MNYEDVKAIIQRHNNYESNMRNTDQVLPKIYGEYSIIGVPTMHFYGGYMYPLPHYVPTPMYLVT